jgi:hypothetical protein
MTCIHGLGSSVVDYVISNILVSNQIATFDLLNDHEPDSDHKPLTLNLNFSCIEAPLKRILIIKGICALTKLKLAFS